MFGGGSESNSNYLLFSAANADAALAQNLNMRKIFSSEKSFDVYFYALNCLPHFDVFYFLHDENFFLA